MKTYTGADIQSDHNPLVGVLKVRIKKVRKNSITGYYIQKLKDSVLRT